MKHEVILVAGISGTGKTTVMRELSKRGVATIGIDEEEHLAYWVEKDSREPVVGDDFVFDQAFLDSHEWVCDISVLKELLLQRDKPVVICGSSDNLREVMKEAEVTLLLSCPLNVFLKRIEERTDNDFGKTEDAKQTLVSYYEKYNHMYTEAGAVRVNAGRSVSEVVDEVMTYIT